MASNEVDTYDETEYDDDVDTEPADVVDTSTAESLDEVHAMAAYNRAVMGPEASDPSFATPGTELPIEPGPGPEDNTALDNATGGALSNAADSGPGAALYPGPHETYANRGELDAQKDANLGIKTTFDLNAPGEQGEYVEGTSGSYDPGAHTVADVEDYIAQHPDEEEAILAAERSGKNRASLVG